MKEEIFTQMALKNWEAQNKAMDEFVDSLSDEDFKKDVAPGKNSVQYLVGHMIAANESMVKIFGLGQPLFPEYEQPFIRTPDHSGQTFPAPSTLKENYKKHREELKSQFEKITPDEWMNKHSLMSDEDFEKEPTRNKMSVLLSRIHHLAYHLGQMKLVK